LAALFWGFSKLIFLHIIIFTMDMDENKLRRIIREEHERAKEAEKKKKSDTDVRTLTNLIFNGDPEAKRIRSDFNDTIDRLEKRTGKDLSDLKFKKPNNRMTLSESFGCFLIIAMFAAFAIWIAWAIFIH